MYLSKIDLGELLSADPLLDHYFHNALVMLAGDGKRAMCDSRFQLMPGLSIFPVAILSRRALPSVSRRRNHTRGGSHAPLVLVLAVGSLAWLRE